MEIADSNGMRQRCDHLGRASIDYLEDAKQAGPFAVFQASPEGDILALFESVYHYGKPGTPLQVLGI